jgi:hypothetical protein
MKKLCKLGEHQASAIEIILKDEWAYNPNKAGRFNVIAEYDETEETNVYWLITNRELDAEYYGGIMYALGMAMQKKYSNK